MAAKRRKRRKRTDQFSWLLVPLVPVRFTPGSCRSEVALLESGSTAGVREVIRMQNEHARRIRQRDSDIARGQREIDRTSQSLNASHRAKLKAIIQLLEKEAIGIELIPPRLTLPYFLSAAGAIRHDANLLRARLNEATKI